MAIQIKGDGQFSIEYEGPYAGLDVSKPETLISDKASPFFNNFMLRNAELRSRPNMPVAYPVFPSPAYQLGITSFLDINGTTHAVIWSGNEMFQFNPAGVPLGTPWNFVGIASPGTGMGSNPVSYRAFANTIYYTNIAFIAGYPGTPPQIFPFLGYWDGIAASPVFTQTYSDGSTSQSVAGISLTDSPTVGGSLPGGPTITGPISIGGGFLGELNNQLILANISIRDQGTGVIYKFPNLLWWSANGLPLQWDPTQNTSAGFNPFLDVSDEITGLTTMGVAGYIFRTQGITQFSPSGSAVNPFTFDHMWASDHGIGSTLPWSIAQYGPTAAFVAADNIYSLSITSAQPIGGVTRDAIFADIANATSTPFANIMPIFKAGYVYLTYQLFIPMQGFVRNYIYSFEDQNWAPWDLQITALDNYPALTCAPNVV